MPTTFMCSNVAIMFVVEAVVQLPELAAAMAAPSLVAIIATIRSMIGHRWPDNNSTPLSASAAAASLPDRAHIARLIDA